ncbi:MAG: DNA polymerase III subunit gamma/tau [Caldilineaceae bacterium]|nr:DNA polymerase III subunit gamma/tau [Caldilineaceae bacterium]
MAQALYRKWRSQTFEDVVGQEHVTKTLLNALRDERVAHAYLFAGPRGTGKTSTARILAKALNCLDDDTRPCNRCSLCSAINEGRLLDLIEIDAASNNSVDDIRELREKVGFQPSEARYKVYIIDEVHMLSSSAFNALLKTLEEPPPYARFVLATTEPHRIPATVLSRCQRFDFRRIPVTEIAAHLSHIASHEGCNVDDAALLAIARSAQGCMRDAVSLLDQMTSFGSAGKDGEQTAIGLEQVQQVLGTAASATVTEFVDVLASNDIAGGLKLVHQLLLQGASLHEFTGQVVDHLRAVMHVQMVGDGALLEDRPPEALETLQQQAERIPHTQTLTAIKRLTQAMTELKGEYQPQLPLELALVELLQPPQPQPQTAVQERPQPQTASSQTAVQERPQPQTASSQKAVQEQPQPQATSSQKAVQEQPQPQTASSQKAAQAVPAPSRARQPAQSDAQSGAEPAAGIGTTQALNADALRLLRQRWGEFLTAVRSRCGPKQQASLRSIKDLAIGADSVAMAFGNNTFAQGVISEAATREAVADILGEFLGQKVSLSCQSGDKANLSAAAGPVLEEEQTAGIDPLIEYAVAELGAEVNDSRAGH